MYIVCVHTHRYQFKAKPFDRDIFLKCGLHGVPRKKEEVHLTDPHTPPLATKERSMKRKAEEPTETLEEEEQTVFHAQPMPNFEKITVSRCVVYLSVFVATYMDVLRWTKPLSGCMTYMYISHVCIECHFAIELTISKWARHYDVGQELVYIILVHCY